MKQRDIEQVMAAAWAVGGGERTADLVRLRQALHAADPHGVYRADAPQSGLDLYDGSTDRRTLRESPRYIRSAYEASTHE